MPDETPEQPDQFQKIMAFYNYATGMAVENGYAVTEVFRCNKCNLTQYITHAGESETLPCIQCKHPQASRVPRKPVAGEATAATYEFAIDFLQQQHAHVQRSGLLPIEAGELNNLSAELRVYLARYGEQMYLLGLKHIKELGEMSAAVI